MTSPSEAATVDALRAQLHENLKEMERDDLQAILVLGLASVVNRTLRAGGTAWILNDAVEKELYDTADKMLTEHETRVLRENGVKPS